MAKREFDSSIIGDMKSAASGSFADNIKMLDIVKLIPHKENFYSMSDIELLADDIEQQGLKHNFVVRDNGDDSFTVISGHRRRQAIQMLINDGRQESRLVPCYINPPKSEDDELQDLIMLNASSRVINDADLVKQYEKLKAILDRKKADGEKFGRIRDKIAKILNVSSGQVAKIENVVNNATPEVREALDKGEMKLSEADKVTERKSKIKSDKANKSDKPPKAKSGFTLKLTDDEKIFLTALLEGDDLDDENAKAILKKLGGS